ncbi:ComF family protein [Falsibacillus albus]|uniref:ComF family protein n=1 Tax=Falsibacillus albus TaxID=2478915 RepID=A0A3L7K461_9BACI|nr:ComF family protein [Falsibacillus albus]RLQ96801.1 ComF family protein [Falsibacillus albus]
MNEPCLFCGREVVPVIDWNTFFHGISFEVLCEDCKKNLQKIEGGACAICSRPLAAISPEFIREEICLDCHKWEEQEEWTGVLDRNTSLFEYNDFLKEYLSRFKYRGDYVLAKGFADLIKRLIKKKIYDYIVPIPLSPERQYERGFNQSEALAKEAGLKTTSLLTRLHSEKQSKKSRQERISLQQVFQLNETASEALEEKSILLIDDIYTTGTTIRQAAKNLKEAGAKKISSLTIARST